MYDDIPRIPDLPAIERRTLQFWSDEKVFRRLSERNAGGPHWSFLDGPITANNPMGVHHAWGRTYKDLYQRYHAMRGFDLRYENGFDCQGLWVEVEVEKSLGFEDRNAILEYGLAEFVRRCKERVLTYAARQTEQSIRLGYWCDWDDPDTLLALRDAMRDGVDELTITTPSGKTVTGTPEQLVGRLGTRGWGGSYFTFSDENNYTIWHFLKTCHEQGYVYRGTDVMPWCGRCGTGLSQMEVAEGRHITEHLSVFVRFPLREREGEALLVWTTTPWTLVANVAAAVHPEMTYLKVRHGDWVYYVGKDNFTHDRVRKMDAGGKQRSARMQSLESMLKGSGELEVLAEIPGEDLVGLTYDGPFDHLAAQRAEGGLDPYGSGATDVRPVDAHRVIGWDQVTGGEGTGVVHIAPGCGAEDHELGRQHGLPVIAPLDAEGRYVQDFGEWGGRSVHEVGEEVAADLKERGLLVGRESYPHVYPHCWRCKEELVFRLVDEWFIDMSWRDRIQKVVPDVEWIPREGEARELDWLKNMGDWMISKKRFWGLALPIWVCGDCDQVTVVGSREELERRAVEGWEEFEGHAPHRPYVDRVKIGCEACGGVATRVEDVGNPWLDAGIVPFSTLHYRHDREYWSKWFPADFVVESFPGQFRNWFYALLAMSAMLEDAAPFRRLLGYALVLDARGDEMHKSTGNAIAFDDAAEIMGADLMRYMYASQNPTQNLLFPDIEEGSGGGRAQSDVRRRLLTLWNCYSFFVTYARADGWRPDGDAGEQRDLDRWILSRLQRLIASAHEAYGGAAVHRFVAQLEQFTDELSNWYIRRSRRRFWSSEASADKQAAFATLYRVLTTTIGLVAPILPFLGEEIYQNLVRRVQPDAPDSLHLTPFPEADPELMDSALERRIDTVIRIKNLGLHLRTQAGVKTRQPLPRLLVRPRDAADRAVLADDESRQAILDECNVKQLETVEDASEWVSAEVKPNFQSLGPRYGSAMKAVAAHLRAADAEVVQAAFGSDGTYRFEVDGEEVEVGPEDIELVHTGPDDLVFTFDQGTFAALETTIGPELQLEGIARDFNRQCQEERRRLDLEITDRIDVSYAAGDRVVEAVERFDDYLRGELLADHIQAVDDLPADATRGKVGGEEVALAVSRSSG